MRIVRKLNAIVPVIFLWLALVVTAVGQEPAASLVGSASGEGTIKLGKEEFKLNAIVVKLFEGGKAEFHLVTDITVFANGTWSRASDDALEIDLKITGNVAAGNMEGSGKLFLTQDKSIKGLKVQVLNKSSRKVIKVDFTAK